MFTTIKTHFARLLDVWLTAGLAALLCFVYFAGRMRNLLFALVPAGLVGGLLGWALLIRMRKREGRTRADRRARRERAVFALSRMEEEKALFTAFEALRIRYGLWEVGRGDKCVLARDEHGVLAVGLCRSMDPLLVKEVQHFDHKRMRMRGVLVHLGEAGSMAAEYAAHLTPPMRLVCAATLPLPDPAPDGSTAGRGDTFRMRIKRLAARVISPGNGKAYMQLAILMLTVFILADSLLWFFCGMVMAALGAASRGKNGGREALFPEG